VTQESEIIEFACGVEVDAISYHNPDVGNLLTFDGDKVGGFTMHTQVG